MRPNRLKSMWKAGKPAAMGWCATADTFTAEVMAHVGFDALLLDTQHGMGIGPDRAAHWLQVVSTTETTPLVRIPWNEPAYVQWALDAGAYGVIVPLVNTPEEAAKAGQACRYPPIGYRSTGPGRTKFYAGADYEANANNEIICLVMIETPAAVGRLDEILKAPGIDGVYIGPSDLAINLGGPGTSKVRDTRHAELCQRVLDKTTARGLVAGVHCASPYEAVERFKQGFKLCPVAIDAVLLESGATAALRAVRGG